MKDTSGMTTEEVLNAISVGQKVYDADGEMVGTLDAVDRAAGCIRVETNPFSQPALDIPIALIRSIDRRELYLARNRNDLSRFTSNRAPGLEQIEKGDGDDR
jgi:hypothetical protein